MSAGIDRHSRNFTKVQIGRKKDARKKDYAQIQRILAEDLPYINLWYFDNVMVYSRRVRNLELNPSGNYDFLKTAELAN